MGRFILWIVVTAALGYGGWYWYSIQPKSFTEIVVQNDSNKDARYPEDVCESILNTAKKSSPTLSCEIADARRVDGDITDVDIQCKGRNSVAGCFVCTIACK
ncbi:MAG: hypothetical protein EXS68_01050 [Candidatus Ryanbacteria bacterium]|nr:hypothetical protein [Candidatus Ryanbacteria bacterium]